MQRDLSIKEVSTSSSRKKQRGAPRWLSQWSVDFGSGHDLTGCEFEPRVGPRADSSEPGACF